MKSIPYGLPQSKAIVVTWIPSAIIPMAGGICAWSLTKTTQNVQGNLCTNVIVIEVWSLHPQPFGILSTACKIHGCTICYFYGC